MENGLNMSYNIENLIASDFVDVKTADVLRERLLEPTVINPIFFDSQTFGILHAVCERLIPQNERENKVDLPGMLDKELTSGTGNGWRYDKMPQDKTAFILGLKGIDETSKNIIGKDFIQLDNIDQDYVLAQIQAGNVSADTWEELPSQLFFEELLATLVELFYSHPLAKEEIGEVSFADAKGWQKIGLNELQIPETKPVNFR